MENKNIDLEKAKNIKLEGDDNKIYCLNDFKDKMIVLYFYGIDNAPGPAIISQNYSSLYQRFLEELNTIVIACSEGHVEEKQQFKKRYNFKQLFLADKELELCKIMNVYKEKKIDEKIINFIMPSAFIFDDKGNLIHSEYNIDYQKNTLNFWKKIKNIVFNYHNID